MNILEKIKNRLLNLDVFKEYEKETRFRSELDNHDIGDVIWALRYDFDWDKDSILEGHQQGPYVVIGKSDNKLICLYCTSNSNNAIELDDYPFFYKKTYVKKLIKIVDYESYLESNYKHKNKLNQSDLNKVLKALKYSSNYKLNYSYFGETKEFNCDFDINLEVGDIVLNDKSYLLIIDKNNDEFVTVSFNHYELEDGSIDYSKTHFNFNKRSIIDPRKVEYVDTLNERDFSIINNKYKEYMNKKNMLLSNKITRGCIVSINNKLYFVYHTDGYTSNAFNIERVNRSTNKTTIINNGYYELNFDNQVVIDNKSDDFKVLSILSDEEIEKVISLKKNDAKIKKEKISKLKNKNNKKEEEKNIITLGNIIKSTKLFSLRYIVLGVVGDKIITISFESFLAGNIIYKIFDINDESLVETKDFNKCELKQVRDNFVFLNELFNTKSEEIKSM